MFHTSFKSSVDILGLQVNPSNSCSAHTPVIFGAEPDARDHSSDIDGDASASSSTDDTDSDSSSSCVKSDNSSVNSSYSSVNSDNSSGFSGSSQHSSGSESENSDQTGVQELFMGSTKKNKDDAILALMDLFIKGRWKVETLKGVLQFCCTFFPSNLPKTHYKLFTYVESFAPENYREICHYYCSDCLSLKRESNDVCLECDCLY